MRLLEIVQLLLPARMSMPLLGSVALKKSKILLLVMTLFWFLVLLPTVPTAEIHLVGRLVPAGPILLFAIILLLLPTTLVPLATVVLNKMFPPAVAKATVDDPRMLQLATMLFCAPPAAA